MHMDRETSRWMDMLTGTLGDSADPTVSSLERDCRSSAAEIESLQSRREPRELLAELEVRVAELAADQKSRLQQRADLVRQAEQMLSERQGKILAQLDAAALDDARETINRAGAFFKEDFSDKSPAQIEQLGTRIAPRMASTKAKLSDAMRAALTLLQDQGPAMAQVESLKVELKTMQDEIGGIEQTLSERHNVKPTVLESLRKLSAEQSTAYRSAVIQPRLTDARFEAEHSLPVKIWNEAAA